MSKPSPPLQQITAGLFVCTCGKEQTKQNKQLEKQKHFLSLIFFFFFFPFVLFVVFCFLLLEFEVLFTKVFQLSEFVFCVLNVVESAQRRCKVVDFSQQQNMPIRRNTAVHQNLRQTHLEH
jgi:hypothetical protein